VNKRRAAAESRKVLSRRRPAEMRETAVAGELWNLQTPGFPNCWLGRKQDRGHHTGRARHDQSGGRSGASSFDDEPIALIELLRTQCRVSHFRRSVGYHWALAKTNAVPQGSTLESALPKDRATIGWISGGQRE